MLYFVYISIYKILARNNLVALDGLKEWEQTQEHY